MKMTVLRHHEQVLEIANKTRLEVLDMREVAETAIAKASIEILLTQYSSEWARNIR
jgi:hypothetical protein